MGCAPWPPAGNASVTPARRGGCQRAFDRQPRPSYACPRSCCTRRGPCTREIFCGPICDEGGETHAVGDTWTCSDGCNTCACTEDGLEQTLLFCTDGSVPTCQVGSETYQVGDSWLCSDGCNQCECTEDGVAQTQIVCTDGSVPTCQDGGETYQVGDSWPCSDSCHTCSCAESGEIARTDEECPRGCSWEGNDYAQGDIVELGTGVSCVCLSTGELGQCTGAILDGGPASEPCSYGV